MLRFRDLGMGCDFEVHGQDETEILTKAAEHAKTYHGGVQWTPELEARIKQAIRDEG